MKKIKELNFDKFCHECAVVPNKLPSEYITKVKCECNCHRTTHPNLPGLEE